MSGISHIAFQHLENFFINCDLTSTKCQVRSPQITQHPSKTVLQSHPTLSPSQYLQGDRAQPPEWTQTGEEHQGVGKSPASQSWDERPTETQDLQALPLR